ncbi:hypothetical protein K4A07_18340, partial [Lactiplantibacillus plantarum]|nr:hypothetical protein [Lactiplantibacillus plantarum]
TMAPITSSDGSRFGDTPLSFEMTRFESAGMNKRSFWRFAVSRYIGHPMIEVDADPEILRAMRTYIDRAIQTVETDGNRSPASNREG